MKRPTRTLYERKKILRDPQPNLSVWKVLIKLCLNITKIKFVDLTEVLCAVKLILVVNGSNWDKALCCQAGRYDLLNSVYYIHMCIYSLLCSL